MNTRVIDGEILTRGVADPLDDMRRYSGVRTRRILAFCIDYLIVGLLLIPAAILVFVLGLITFSLGWALFGILLPLVALAYVGITMGGPAQATIGMRVMGIKLARLDGTRVDGIFAILHSVLFWAANALLTPLVLLVTLFTDRKRALHDLLLGTVIVRSDG